MVRLCDEADAMTDRRANVCRQGNGASHEAGAMREQIDAVLQQVKALTTDAVIKQVRASSFNETCTVYPVRPAYTILYFETSVWTLRGSGLCLNDQSINTTCIVLTINDYFSAEH